jgi:DNA-binding NarL/FixJ family response regulator
VDHTINLLIVDDHPLFRQGVRCSLEEEQDMQVTGEVPTAEEALESIRVSPPDIVVADLHLPKMDAIDLTCLARLICPTVRVIVLSISNSDEQAFNVLRSGAAAYLSKEIHPGQLAQSIRRVAHGECLIDEVILNRPEVASRVLNHFQEMSRLLTTAEEINFSLFAPLGEREVEVLEKIVAGSSHKEIADSLRVSPQTIKSLIASTIEKLSLNDRTQAMIYAMRRDRIEAPEGESRSTAPQRVEHNEGEADE